MSEEQNIHEEKSGKGNVNERFPEDSQAPKPATENMEVHYHPHPDNHPGGKKNWKAYLREFFMLFLAVFCGFLAEYFLEHRIEKERGKQYIESFYGDLKTDTARLDTLVRLETKKIGILNKLPGCYDSLLRDLNPAALLGIIKNSLTNNPFLMDGRTLRQLNNAGGFRLLQQSDADSIISYEKYGNTVEEYQSTVYQQSQDNLRNTFNEIADFIPYTKLYSDIANTPTPDATEMNTPVILTKDKAMLNKYFNQLFQYLRVIVQHRNRLIKTKLKADGLLAYFENKYHLE